MAMRRRGTAAPLLLLRPLLSLLPVLFLTNCFFEPLGVYAFFSSPTCKQILTNLVSAGPYHTCARNWSSGSAGVICWGWNEFGQLNVPAEIPFAQVSCGSRHTCGIGTKTPITACLGGIYDARICSNDAALISANAVSFQTCKVGKGQCVNRTVQAKDQPFELTQANIYCWGSNAFGQAPPNLAAQNMLSCSDSDNTCTSRALSSLYLDKLPVLISAGGIHTCVVWLDGTVSCFGANNFNQTVVPEELQGGWKNNFGVIAISSGMHHSCVIVSDKGFSSSYGRLRCWGSNLYNQTDAPKDVLVSQVSAGSQHTCAITHEKSEIVCWGSNEYGQASAPGLTIGQKYVRLSCGMAYSCALRVDQAGIEDGIGFLVCFGNYSGYINPKDGAIIRERSSIAVGQSHACITDAVDGLVSCWQGDFASQLPDGITVVPACVNPCQACSPPGTL